MNVEPLALHTHLDQIEKINEPKINKNYHELQEKKEPTMHTACF